jgi:hypothetical protein
MFLQNGFNFQQGHTASLTYRVQRDHPDVPAQPFSFSSMATG